MPFEPGHPELPRLLETIRSQAVARRLAYAGGVPSVDAWRIVQTSAALLIDVRSIEERKFVGHVPCSWHVPWATGVALTRNPRFVRELEARIVPGHGKDTVLLFLCRSGTRSALAAAAATKAGFRNAFNVLEGFEGGIDADRRRGSLGGWRHHGLPWIQD
jgi:rhodanese-related sulfurtransferase